VQATLSDTHREWIEAALDAHKFSIARLISLFEDQRPEAVPQRAAVLAALDTNPRARRATFLGITGTPGAGKSTLTGQLARRMHAQRSDLRFAVLAVDPSSRFSGGALLGDRTRVRFATGDARLFFRSQASDTELGGLSPRSFQVCRLLYRLFDCVIIETVGIGQSEVDIRFLADRVYLVVQPMGGDEIQFLKAGIMEVPDEIVLNKCDAVDAARRSYQALKSSMALARPFDGDAIPIHRVSATEGMGLDRTGGAAAGGDRRVPRGVPAREGRALLRQVGEGGVRAPRDAVPAAAARGGARVPGRVRVVRRGRGGVHGGVLGQIGWRSLPVQARVQRRVQPRLHVLRESLGGAKRHAQHPHCLAEPAAEARAHIAATHVRLERLAFGLGQLAVQVVAQLGKHHRAAQSAYLTLATHRSLLPGAPRAGAGARGARGS
jgi:LAO/AO transport system kinase